MCVFTHTHQLHKLNEYLPLKQGLRLSNEESWGTLRLNEYLPLKQGLRPAFLVITFTFRILNEYLPLKQGLRLLLSSHNSKSKCNLNEYLPLKQGLRRFRLLRQTFGKDSMSIFH